MTDIKWPHVSTCQHCGSDCLLRLQNEHRKHTARIWDGATWLKVQHGSLICKDCRSIHKLNYISTRNQKVNFLTDVTDEQVYLLTPHIGFTVGYAKQLWNRICRMHCSLRGEACAILLTKVPEDIPKTNCNDAKLSNPYISILSRQDTTIFSHIHISTNTYTNI